MNQSRLLRKELLVSLLMIAVVSSLLLPCIPGAGGERMSWDAVNVYSRCIETENVSNWHSSLFMYECIALKRVIGLVTGQSVCGVEVLRIAWCCFSLVMLVFMIVLAFRLVRHSWVWIMAFPCCIYLALKITLPHFYQVGVSLDYYFMCLLWPLLAALVEYFNCELKGKRLVWLVVVMIVLLHVVSYRRNAVLFVPVLMGCLLYGAEWFRMLSWGNKFVVWCASVAILLLVAFSGVDAILPVSKARPLVPMMESDVRIASILRGEQDEFRKQGFFAIAGDKAERKITAFWYNDSKCRAEWTAYRDIYVEEWRAHPETMMAASIIQRIQFYCGGLSFQFLKEAVESRYPIVKNNPKAWEACAPLVYDSPCWRLFWICMAPFCALVGYAVWRKQSLLSPVVVICTTSAAIAALYACSYMVVVPTPDARYLAPSYMFVLVAAPMLVVELAKRAHKRVSERW